MRKIPPNTSILIKLIKLKIMKIMIINDDKVDKPPLIVNLSNYH
jgi:hypothetical protein